MAADRIRNPEWQEDIALKQDLSAYVQPNLRQKEIFDLVGRKYPMYAWSLRTLSRHLSFFNIKYSDYDVDIDRLKEVINMEMEGPGCLLGYRALQQKVREVHGLNVPRDLVYAMMMEVNPQGLEERGGVGRPKRDPRNKVCTSQVNIHRNKMNLICTLYVNNQVKIYSKG